MFYNIIAFSIAAAGAFALSPLCFPISRLIGAIDVPTDSRRMHKKPIPRIGGLAVLGGFLMPVPLFDNSVSLLSGALIIVSVGIIDDVYRIDAYSKLIYQVAAAAMAVLFGARVPIGNSFLSVLLSFLWLIVLPNAFNLIDGLDGLCVRVALFSALSLFLLGASPMAIALAGALFGFLPYNLRRAKMFLGDTGALFVGFALGVISLDTLSKITFEKGFIPIALVFALPLADTSFAFLRRIAKGKNPFSPDREHFHHKLIDRGFSHREASFLLSLIALALCSVALAI